VTYELIVVGASWGGLRALSTVLGRVPGGLSCPIAVVQHRRHDAVEGGLSKLLQLHTAERVVEAEDKMAIEPHTIYVAPPDYHLLVERGAFALSVDERVQYARPSIDVLFESAADAYGPHLVGVVLTGANEDGAAGLARVKERGGVAIVQDPGTAERAEMPAAAAAATAADAVLPLDEIGPFLYGLCCAMPSRSATTAERTESRV
jgi:two-component system, chemotaxis family, protein-glutamate methylesterase/glutaminase